MVDPQPQAAGAARPNAGAARPAADDARFNAAAPGERCLLCGGARVGLLHRDRARRYLRCAGCELTFVPAGERLGPAAEKARYDMHQNDPADPRYRRFLTPLAEAVVAATPAGAEGLDFGCGPGPALAAMLRESGRRVALYDPYYARDEAVWRRRYDFITASEVFEHLYDPRAQLARLFDALRPGGVLAVMTSMTPASPEAFAAWHYIRDETHVCFYAQATFEHIAATWAASIERLAGNVVVLRTAGA